jgi:hypothetical protein
MENGFKDSYIESVNFISSVEFGLRVCVYADGFVAITVNIGGNYYSEKKQTPFFNGFWYELNELKNQK